MLKNMYRRKPKGQSMVVLVVFLIVFLILLLGMTAFEFGRYSLCCQQFQHCVDIAALGGASGLASAQTTNQALAQTAAMDTAKWIMEQNYVMDKSLTGMTTFSASASSPATPGTANRANINFNWLDPETGLPTGVAGDQKIFALQGAYAYPPLVGSWIGLGPSALLRASANGNGGGTMLDVVLCFDLSGSIDDSTFISMVDRYSPAVGSTVYTIKADDTLYAASQETSLTGTGFNALYPQNLSSATWGTYSFARRGNTQGQRAPQAAATGGDTFTDVVVNLDENATFGGGTFGGLPFPTVGALVEAARGNLESIAIANAASVNYAGMGVTPQSGYYRTYWEQAQTHRHPLYDAQASSSNFFQIINNSTNAHFGLVGFSTDENTTATPNCIDGSQSHVLAIGAPGNINTASTVQVKMPWVVLNPLAGSPGSNFAQINAVLPLPPILPATVTPNMTNDGNTDINGSLNQAMNWLTRTAPTNESAQWPGPQSFSRIGAKRAIVLFTDGLPTADTGPNFTGSGGSVTASHAGNLGIQIYCIGLAQVPGLVPSMNATLNPIAANSGGKFYLIPPGAGQAAALNRAFSDIARSLVTLTR